MATVAIETTATRHRKVVGLSDSAFRLWISSICHARDQGTDGELFSVDLDAIPRCPKGRVRVRIVCELVTAGLWEVCETGWIIHDYSNWNDTRATVELKRKDARERMAKLRAGSREHPANFARSSDPVRDGSGSGSRNLETLDPPCIPPPGESNASSRLLYLGTTEPRTSPVDAPVQENRPRGRADAKDAPTGRTARANGKRKSVLPDDFAPDVTAERLARQLGVVASREFLKFRDHHQAKGTLMLDWQAAFRTWIRNSAEWRQPPGRDRGNGGGGNGTATGELSPAAQREVDEFRALAEKRRREAAG